MEEVRINIRTNYLVEENNADSVNGNTYTWIFDKDTKKSINMLINTSTNDNSANIGIVNVIFPIICIVLFVFVVLLILFQKNNKNNKI